MTSFDFPIRPQVPIGITKEEFPFAPGIVAEFADVDGDNAAVQSAYGALTLDRVAFFSHMIPRTQRGYIVVIDQDTSLATGFEIWLSGYQDNREVQRQIYYGYVNEPGKTAPTARHGVTNRIEGKGFYWKQNDSAETNFIDRWISNRFAGSRRR